MLLIHHTHHDPYFNIALEEYLLHNQPREVIMLWWSEPSVIIGKHQNALAEVNYPFVMRNNIPVIRRLSGGGTVFHAPGNLNFSFIFKGEPGNLVNFRKHTAPVIAFLNELGVDATFAGKNDIRAGNLKVSGNAEHVYKDRVLHHGTLLYDADLQLLREAIRVDPGRYEDISIQSVRSQVANISDLLDHPPTFEGFAKLLEGFLEEFFGLLTRYELTASDRQGVERLVREKYSRWEWNYARSPSRYTFTGKAWWNGLTLTSSLEVKSGSVISARIRAHPSSSGWMGLATDLAGRRHEPEEIWLLLQKYGLIQRSDQCCFPDDLYPLFF